MSKAYNPKHWEVTVLLDSEIVLAISHCHLAVISNIAEYSDTVQLCAEQLLAFIGRRSSEQERFQGRLKELEHEIKMAKRHLRDVLSERHAIETALSDERQKTKKLEAEIAELWKDSERWEDVEGRGT